MWRWHGSLRSTIRGIWRAAPRGSLFIFPTSYFLHIDYSESLFLALVLASFIAARRERWLWAGIFGAFAALARPNGILLLPALGADALWELWETHRFNWRWLWAGLVPVGFSVYLWVNYRITGDALAFLKCGALALVRCARRRHGAASGSTSTLPATGIPRRPR